MNIEIDVVQLNATDTAARMAYVQALIAECQARARDITPKLETVISAYWTETDTKVKEAILVLILQAGRNHQVHQLCQSERISTSSFVREKSVWYLARYYPDTAIDLYREQADDPYFKVRFWIATRLEEYNLPAAIELYLSVWADPAAPPDLREGIENDLALIGNQETIPELRRLAKCVGGENLLIVVWRIERRLAVEYLEPPTKPSERYFVKTIACSQCGRTLTVDSRYMGARARCKECGSEFKVPHW
ncbi:MAG: hypothetical protein JRC86_02225 [Deltaproteobacteria bacterium]|nr:hypothetical protein [Deltaproteobacteria bacterium]